MKKKKQNKETSHTAANTPNSFPAGRTLYLQGFLLLCIPLLLYLRTIGFEFSFHDDDVMIIDGAKVLSQRFSFENIFLTDAWLLNKVIELYRPLQSLSYWLDFQIAGTKPGWYHAHNLLLHLLNSLLLWQLLFLLTRHRLAAWTGALIWSLNFLNTHAVCWVPARGDLLLATWGFLFLISWIKVLHRGPYYWQIFNLVTFTMALFAKENAILLPFFAALIWWWQLSADHRKKSVVRLFPSVLVWLSAMAFYLRLRNQSIASEGQNLSLTAFINNIRVLPESILKWLVPVKFSVMPGYDIALSLGGIALLAALIVMLISLIRKRQIPIQLALFGAALLIVPLLPSMFYSPLFVSYGYDYLDHRMYFPSAGLALLIGCLAGIFSKDKKSEVWPSLPWAAGAILYCGTFAFLHSGQYRNYDSYYQNAIRTNPRSGLALTNYGILKRKAGDQEAAEKWLTQAMRVAPQYDFLQIEYAILQNEKRNYSKALEILDRLMQNMDAIRVEKDLLYCHRGIALAGTGAPQKAAADFLTAISINSRDFVYYQNLGAAYEDTRQDKEAFDAYGKALELNPKAVQCLFRRGFLHGKYGRPAEAVSSINQAIAIDGNRGDLYYYLALAHKDLGDMDTYCANMKQAASLQLPEAVSAAQKFCQ